MKIARDARLPLICRILELTAALLTLLGGISIGCAAESAADAAHRLAPSGRLRVAINLGNPILAQRDAASGKLLGVSVVIAERLGERLHVPLDLIPFNDAGDVFDAVDRGAWDVAFLAIEPERAVKVYFSSPYVFIDGTYLVHRDSPYQSVADLDKDGVRIAVNRGAAYDLFLTRTLQHASLRRAPSTPASIDLFITDKLDAAAGVRQVLLDEARKHPDTRVLDDRFTRIAQAIAIPKDRADAGAFVQQVLTDMKASGEIHAALVRDERTDDQGLGLRELSR
jgi:polar amino acid transport system substrate-binding protein